MITWEQLCEDKRFGDVPFKVETNSRGQIIMTARPYFHGRNAYAVSRRLEDLMPAGETVVKCAVQTADGVKEADCAWLSQPLADQMQDAYACSPAPEICVEVISPSNSAEEMLQKRQLFIAAGAREYWLCDAKGNMKFCDGVRQLEASLLCPGFPAVLPKRRG